MAGELLELTVTEAVIYWRGPSPFHFVPVPAEPSAMIKAVASIATYGWGVIPVTVDLGGSTWTTSLFPKDGRYLVPIRDAVRAAEGIAIGDLVTLRLTIRG